MKKTILILAMALGLSAAVKAQDGTIKSGTETNKKERKKMAPDERAKFEAERAEKDLGLTSDQKTKWEEAARERTIANQGIKEKLQGSTTPEERKVLHQQAKANNKKFDESVSAFLTEDQKTKHQSLKKERHEKRKKKAHHRHQAKPKTVPENK